MTTEPNTNMNSDQARVVPTDDIGSVSDRTRPEYKELRRALVDAMRVQGCLCLYSRCPVHGEGTGAFARAYLAAGGGVSS